MKRKQIDEEKVRILLMLNDHFIEKFHRIKQLEWEQRENLIINMLYKI